MEKEKRKAAGSRMKRKRKDQELKEKEKEGVTAVRIRLEKRQKIKDKRQFNVISRTKIQYIYTANQTKQQHTPHSYNFTYLHISGLY